MTQHTAHQDVSDEPTDFGATHYRQDGDVAILTIDNPPANALSLQVRLQLQEGLERARVDPTVSAVVLIGSERAFCSGADIRQFNTPAYWSLPRTWHLAEAVEASEKPVVAAIGGFAMGGGLEIAMAAHARVANAHARLALPEIKLGVIPAAGGILRLPRLVGLPFAYDLITSGKPISAVDAKQHGLVDEVSEGDLLEAAKELARNLARRRDPPPLPRTVERPIPLPSPTWREKVRSAEQTALSDPARSALAACFDALLSQPTEVVHQIVQKHSDELVASPRAQALRHVFLGQRSIARTSGKTERRFLLEALAEPSLSQRVSQLLAAAGIPVRCHDAIEACGKDVILLDLAPADGDVWARRATEPMAGAAAIASVNTKGVAEARAPTFLDPAQLVGLALTLNEGAQGVLEIAPHPSTSPDVTKTLVAAARRMGLVPAITGEAIVGVRLQEAFQRELSGFLAGGASAESVQSSLVNWGFSPMIIESELSKLSSSAGCLPHQNGDVHGSDVGSLVARAMAREGAQLIATGAAPDATTIDMIAVFGLGFPAERGGPMFHAKPSPTRPASRANDE